MPSAHPEPGLLAAHAEGRLSAAEAAQMDEHLAGCSSCHEVFAETLRFGLDEAAGPPLDEVAAGMVPSQAAVVVPFVRRPAFRLAAVLAVAATVVLAFQQLWLPRFGPGSSDPVGELVRAMGTTRFIEPRLVGGFEHGRFTVLRSAEKPQGLDAFPPAVIAAVARVREKTEGDSSPQALGALAVTFLISGDVAKAVTVLESATAKHPKNPRLLSDLSAAYLVRAGRLDEPADIPKALETAEKAIAIQGAPSEAWFNRALALEQMHLVDSAKKAWTEFLERDSTSAWADEARKRIDEMPAAQQSTLDEDRARAREAVAGGRSAIDALADESPSILADYFRAELLPAWSDAYLTGHSNAAVLRAEAEQVAEALFRTTGDALPRDAARALSLPASGAARDPPHLQAQGYKALREAQRLYDLSQDSCPTFRESRRLLESGGSPYVASARERVVVACLYPKADPGVLPELASILTDARQRGYSRLIGRAHWMTALTQANTGDYDRAAQNYRLAQEVYRTLRDPEEEGSVSVRLAIVLTNSGDSRAGWRERLHSLALLGAFKQASRREAALLATADACWRDRLAATAVHALTEYLDATRRNGRRDLLAYGLIWRGQVLHALGQQERAMSDLAEARSNLASARQVAYADNIAAFANVVEGRILGSVQPDRAIASLQQAVPYFERTASAFVPALRVDMARALRARGREGEAEAELAAAIRQVESQASGAEQQAGYFDYAASAPFDEMVALQLDARDDPVRALEYVERSRGRRLKAQLLARPRKGSRIPSATPREPSVIASETLQRRLPRGVALVYYVVLPDRLTAFVLSQTGVSSYHLSVAPDQLESRVVGYASAVEAGAPLSAIRAQGGALFDGIVRPLLPALAGHESLVLIPDAALQSLPFASLWNRDSGRYLVEDYRLDQAPSGFVFLHASAAAEHWKPGHALRLLAVGNPRLAPGSGLPRLAGSELEAREVARLYADSALLLDTAATKHAFLESLVQSDVVHYAGHALQGDVPGSGRLLLAPDRDAGSSGVLRADEIASNGLERTRLVVLAGCRTATGERSRFEGVRGMTRPFLAAGVSMVVASLWDVDDAASRAFFSRFHRLFLAEGDAAAAVRGTQLALLAESDPVLSHPSRWAGFVSFGGLLRRGPPQAPHREAGL
jgi:CHAT domain-containing protein